MKTVFFKLLFIFICIGLATSCDNEPTGAVANMSAIPLAPCDRWDGGHIPLRWL